VTVEDLRQDDGGLKAMPAGGVRVRDRFVVVKTEANAAEASDVYLVTNWFEELRARMGAR